jgi:heptosyltransferase II
MKILIELPNWLGDAVMASPAIENLANYYSNSEITLIGSLTSIEIIKSHPQVTKTYALSPKYIYSLKTIINLNNFDIYLSFRGSLRAQIYKFLISAPMKYNFNKKKYPDVHQVEKYNNFVREIIKTNVSPGSLILHNLVNKNIENKKKFLGLNPGASYGSSKRWYPEEFANVAKALSNNFDVIIFGGPDEVRIAKDIETSLLKKGIKNYKNLAGKTSVAELVDRIANLDLFITGDSGPMHIAAAFQIPTVAVFGPTRDYETSQWKNKKSIILKKKLDCQPCMKRSCPLNHHNCMKLIKSSDALDAIERIS